MQRFNLDYVYNHGQSMKILTELVDKGHWGISPITFINCRDAFEKEPCIGYIHLKAGDDEK